MATRYGHDTYLWLLERGWKAASLPDEDTYGDNHVIDPETKQEEDVYIAVRIHKGRTGEFPEWLKDVI